jgi:hypothetical protein
MLDVIEPGFDHRLGARLAVFVQQVLFQAAGVHADPHGAAMVARRADHLAHAVGLGADIAGVDPQAGRARLRRLDPALVVEMDVGHDRHRAFAHDLLERLGARLIGHRDAHDIGAGLGRRLHLRDGAGTSVVTVLVMVCTLIGASPPTGTLPTMIWRLRGDRCCATGGYG